MTRTTRECRLAPPNIYAEPWSDDWRGVRNASTEGLIKDNLWKEADVSRATMNRAARILAEWKTASAPAAY
jgi:hypothetical protein